jgi:hypothetical protein
MKLGMNIMPSEASLTLILYFHILYMWHAWGRGEVFTEFWLGGPRVETTHWEDLGIGERITSSWTLGRYGSMGRTGFSWLRIGSNGGLL